MGGMSPVVSYWAPSMASLFEELNDVSVVQAGM